MIRDTTMWTVAAQGTTPTGARVVLHRTRTSTRDELVVGGVVTSYGPGRGNDARDDFERACAMPQGRAA
ncbi:MAG: hypothetical protein ACEQSX_10725 [Baekduiaceae bacterium]